MATADQLKQGGNAAKLGAMSPPPVARGFTPASGNSSTPKPGAARHHPVGKITGKGTGTSDQVPINASNGEFIIKAAAVKIIGLEALEALNAVADGPDEKDGKAEAMAEYGDAKGMKCGGKVKGMATGGLVDEQKKNSFGDAASRIPAGAGTYPAPAPDGKESTELGRQVNNSITALGGMGAVASVPLKTAQAVQGGAMRAAPVLTNSVPRLVAPAVPDFVAGMGAGSTVHAGQAAYQTLPAANVAMQEGARVNQMANATRGFSNAGSGLVASDAHQTSATPAATVNTPAAPATQKVSPVAAGFAGAEDGIIPGSRAVMNGFADDANRNIKEGNYGALAGNTIKATATMPFALAADAARPITSRLEGIGRGFYNAASTLFGGNENAGNATPASAAPVASDFVSPPAKPSTQAATVKPATAPANPDQAPPVGMPGQVTKTMQPNGVTSYSGENVTGDINLSGNRGGVISAQNNQAAENLARAGGQTRGFGPAGAIRGGGQVSSMDTSAGYAADLKQLAENATTREAENANMQAQADYAQNFALQQRGFGGSRAALQMLAQNKNNAVTKRGQDMQAKDARDSNRLAQENQRLAVAKDGREATAAGFTSRAAGRIEALQASYEAAKPEDRAAIAEQLRVMTGKDKPSQWKALALQGATDSMGNKTEGVLAAVNEQTGEVKRLDHGQGAAPAAAPKPGEARNGYKFKGGNPADQTNWEKI